MTCLALAGPVRDLPKSDANRKKVLDLLRPKIEKDLGQKVIFTVSRASQQDGFVFVMFSPMRANGKPIDYLKTKYAAAKRAGAFDNGGVALFRKSGGSWKMLDWTFGRTDVGYVEWPEKYHCTKELLGMTG